MERIPPNPPPIPKVPTGVNRPHWSVMIPVFNSANTLVDTLRSVLIQDPGPEKMQIMVIDDCSDKDDLRSITRDIGNGRIEYYRKEENEGHVMNYNSCIQMSRGYYIHILHADDKIHRDFYEEFEALFTKYPEADAAYSRWEYINNMGYKIGTPPKFQNRPGIANELLENLAVQLRMQYVTTVVKREVYETVGGFYGVNYGEDWLMWARIAAAYKWAYTPTVLGQYREHALGSMSMTSIKDGSNVSDIFFVMNKIAELLHPEEKQLAQIGFKNYLIWTLIVMKAFWTRTFDDELVEMQIRNVTNYHVDDEILARVENLKRALKFRKYYEAKNFLKKYLKPSS